MQKRKISIFAMHLSYGGIEKYISSLCKMLKNDYEIEIITTYKFHEKPAFDFDKNIKIKYLINENPTTISLKELIKSFKFLKATKEIVRRIKFKYLSFKLNVKEIKNLKSDIVITTRTYHNKLVNNYCKSNIKKIATEHNYHNNDKKYVKALMSSITNFDYFAICTKELYDYYKKYYDEKKLILISNPVDIYYEGKSKLNNKQLITVGRLSPEKGHMDLIETFKYINDLDKNINLVICGDGYIREYLENKIKELNLEKNIKIKGFLKGENLYKEYINSSIFVLPSISESFGIVLLEAMHFGLPCISFSSSGANELLKNNIGVIIKNRDKKELAKKIVEMINNKEELKEYQNKSLQKVKNYYLNVLYEEWKKILI